MARNSARVCSTPGCPVVVDKAGRCPGCLAKAEQTRGNATQRGYDAGHRATKARLLAALRRTIAAGRGPVRCPRCGEPMTPDMDLDAGHSVDRALNPGAKADRLEHAVCNRGAGGRLGAMITNAR